MIAWGLVTFYGVWLIYSLLKISFNFFYNQEKQDQKKYFCFF